mmetsp:Transcript_44746/g.97233  ORF Transcript_44746/g.97233 Transcript_44746/m.97233 type:complete len:240 (+) Transcript_44746:84-803(+)
MALRRFRLQAAAAFALLLCGWHAGEAWLFPQAGATTRREILGLAGLGAAMHVEPALASGGSTAGKYSTIPSGKRRFYGRVRQGLYQYLLMEPAIKAGNLQAPEIEDFFSMNIVKVKGGMPMKNCGFGGTCKTKEKRTSRWLDFKTATDLLAGAFRYDAGDVPDFLPGVKVIRAFAKKVTRMEEAINEGNVQEVQQLYAKSKLDLSRYLPLVELEPLDSQDYTHEWDTRPQVWCQGQFCV